MATFKAEVYAHQKRADGTYNIKIRVIHQKRKKYIPTTYYVTKDDLTRTTFKLKNQKYIDATDDMIKKYRSICDRMGERLKSMTVEQVVDAITNDNGEHFDLDIVAYARQYILHLKETGHTGNALSYQVAINNLVRFVGRDSVSIKEITSGGALVFDLFPSVWADGESVMNKDGSEATLDNDSMKGVLDAYKELANTTNGLGAGSKEETGATWTAPFANGKIGVMPYPNTSTTALFDAEKDGGFEVGVAPIPGTKEGKTSTFLGGDAMGISKDSKHVAQAWNFLYWLMQSDAQKEVFADQGDTASNIQTLKTAYKDADPRIQTINSVIIDGNGQTPKSPAFNEAFNAAGSPWQLLVQNAVWGSGDLKADNKAVTDVLSAQ